jgi:hypothetical protein
LNANFVICNFEYLRNIRVVFGKEWLWIEINGGSSLGRSRLELSCRTRRRSNFEYMK